MIDNYTIADNFSLLSKLMDIHNDNSFKAKSYSSAAFTIEKLPMQLFELPIDKIFTIKGIGETTGKKIIEQLQTGQLTILNEYISKTPPGILEMLTIKGIGPKKIATIWKELEIETLGELLYACNENRLTLYKGFAEKTQQNIKEAIEFYFSTSGIFLYQQVESYTKSVEEGLYYQFSNYQFAITGSFKQQFETIEKLEWITTCPLNKLHSFFTENNFTLINETENYISLKGKENLLIGFFYTNPANFYWELFATSSSDIFLKKWNSIFVSSSKNYTSEEDIFSSNHLPFIPSYLRETETIIDKALQNNLPEIILPNEIKGIIHSHSKWSDGVCSVEEMAKACIEGGVEYLVISDHSKSAFYANGLNEERIIAQHEEIDILNKKLNPFKIYKSIESDILNDGSLDYNNTILNSFDIIIASIHSNLKMSEDKAMMRLLKAIENPFTSIIGHMTGRLLLSRKGYPIDHKKIIDACAANDVVIELNAHPRRLDIDWRWIDYALTKNVLISINPDAHSIDGFDDCRFGVLVAQKAGLTKEKNLSSFSITDFEKFLLQQKTKRK